MHNGAIAKLAAERYKDKRGEVESHDQQQIILWTAAVPHKEAT